MVSHELKTPLAVLQLSVQALLRGVRRQHARNGEAAGALIAGAPGDGVALEARLLLLERQVQRLTRLIDNLLTLSRLRVEGPALAYEEFDLSVLCTEVLALLAPELTAAGCSVLLRTPGSVLGRWDRLRLEQVLVNLLSNAAHFAADGPIEVLLSGDAKTAWLEVRDRGIGISKPDQRRLFERYARILPSGQGGGLGLGLWICQQIVLWHGGAITVCSEPGAGATFTVTLPREPQTSLRPLPDVPEHGLHEVAPGREARSAAAVEGPHEAHRDGSGPPVGTTS